jgi:rhamnosyl/mannosyltransferase
MLHYPNPMAVLALFLSLLARRKREKIVVWYHADVILEGWWKRAVFSLYRPMDEFVFRRADVFVAATPHHVRQSPVLARFRDRVSTIPFAVPDSWFDVLDEEFAAAKTARERVGERFALFVGRLAAYKGLDTLVRAAGHIGCRIVVVGTGPLEGYLWEEIRLRGLEGKIIPLGRVEDPRPWYLGCEFLVLPSNSALEAFGIVQIEAMGLGKPVVSSDLPTGVTYVNRDGETGLTFPVGDPDAFAAACNRLLGDDALRTRLGETARARTMREFSYSALAESAIPLFQRLCREPGN